MSLRPATVGPCTFDSILVCCNRQLMCNYAMPFPKLDADWFWRAGLNPDSALPEWKAWDRPSRSELSRVKKVLQIASGLGEATIRNYLSEYKNPGQNRSDHVGPREI